ncbi:MAG: GyrI-like domain-containing protein [Bacteroidota bacterium]
MEPRITQLPKTFLIGQRIEMSLANNKTSELWQLFMPNRSQIKNTVGSALYSVDIFPSTDFFQQYDPTRTFEKWAAVAVNNLDTIPDGMDSLSIPEGQYAVFHYVGKPSEAQPFMQYIFNQWLPNSPYELDDRPHLAIMGDKYKGEYPDSEEDLWIPIC